MATKVRRRCSGIAGIMSINRKRNIVIRLGAVATLTMLCSAVTLGTNSKGQPLDQQIVGTWTLVSVADVHQDGTRVYRLGPNPKGSLMFDRNGRYVLLIVRADLPKFASGKGDQGTDEENKAVMRGLVGHFGSYFVNPAEKTLTIRAEGSWLPNLNGLDRKLFITSLTEDELKYTNPAPAVVGTNSEVVWKRVK